MITADFEFLKYRMALLDEAAFAEFVDTLHDPVRRWLTGFGYTLEQVNEATPRCIMELGVLVATRASEIDPRRFLRWCHIQLRSLEILYWRRMDMQSRRPMRPNAQEVCAAFSQLDGTVGQYQKISTKLGVTPNWLRARHHNVVAATPSISEYWARAPPS